MNAMRIKAKTVAIGSLLVCFCAIGNAQDYYGGGGSNWRRQPSNNEQTPKDKDNTAAEPSGYMSINFGFATPEGPFAQEIGSGYGGYAQSGGTIFDFSLGIPINHSNFGFALMLGSENNNYDINTYANNMSSFALPPNTDQSTYSESSILGGLYVTYPIGRLSIDGRAMLGALLCALPEQNYGFFDQSGNSWDYDLQPSNSTSLAFDLGIGARFMIAEFSRRKLCLMVNVDYLYSSVSYNTQQYQYETYASGPNMGTTVQYVPSPTFSGSFPLELLNVTFGIGYQL
jgi:hypothetical protein